MLPHHHFRTHGRKSNGKTKAFGKIGAFVGTWVFPHIQDAGGDDAVKRAQYPFWVASSLCILSAAIAFFCLPNVGQDTIHHEDIKFREYLESKGWDTTQLGLLKDDEVVASAGEEPHTLTETKN